jgi:hypothetical protein
MTKVYCYRNLMFKNVVWSVKSVKTGLVIDRSPIVVISNAQLKVSQAGRNRVLLERRKNVHAGIQGIRIKRAPKGNWLRAEYNPYKWNSFVLTGTGIAITHARYAKLTSKGLFVLL